MSESQQFTGVEWAEIGFGGTEQNTRQNRDARRVLVVDLVAMAGLALMLVWLARHSGKEKAN